MLTLGVNGSIIGCSSLSRPVQHIEFMGRSDAFFSSGSLKSNNVTSVVATKTHGSVAAGETDRWDNEPLFVPSLPPSKLTNCRIINISYAVKVIFHSNSLFTPSANGSESEKDQTTDQKDQRINGKH